MPPTNPSMINWPWLFSITTSYDLLFNLTVTKPLTLKLLLFGFKVILTVEVSPT